MSNKRPSTSNVTLLSYLKKKKESVPNNLNCNVNATEVPSGPSTSRDEITDITVNQMDLSDDEGGYSTQDEKTKRGDKSKYKKGAIKKSYKKKFMLDWLKMPEFKNWLLKGKTDNEAICKVCNVTFKAGKSELQKHAAGKNHIKKVELEELSGINQPNISTFVSQNSLVKNVEAAICTFVVENNLHISLVEPMVDLIKSLPEKAIIDKIQLGKQKATNVIRNGLRPFFHEDLLAKLKSNFFSVYVDESTDISVKKQLAILVSFCENFQTNVDIVDLVDCPDGTALSIYNKVINSLKENNIPVENWIGFCSDTTSTMMGQHNSVSQLIQDNHPQVHVLKCACHMIHLVGSYACKKLSNSLEDLCRNIFNHFSRSPKNSAAYKEFQAFFDVKPHKMLKPCQTRWLSLQACVQRILEQWEALEHYWKLLYVEDPTHSNLHTRNSLQNPLLKCLMYFVEYNLGLFNNFNTFFQADFPVFPELKDKVEELVKTLALNFMRKEYVKETSAMNIDPLLSNEYVGLSQVYLGVQATTLLNETPNKELTEVERLMESARAFYIESVIQIQKRFVFTDVHKDASFLLPKNASNLEPATIYHIAKKYLPPHIKLNLEELDREWRNQGLISSLETDTNIVEYWKNLFSLTANGKSKFVHLPVLVNYFLGLPFSNAIAERLFSAMNLVKNEKRNRLDNETVTSVLSVKYGLKRTKKSSVQLMKNQFSVPHLKFVQANATASQSKEIRLRMKAGEDVEAK